MRASISVYTRFVKNIEIEKLGNKESIEFYEPLNALLKLFDELQVPNFEAYSALKDSKKIFHLIIIIYTDARLCSLYIDKFVSSY